MPIPIRYNLRSLRVRWRLSLATALGIGLVVAVFVMVMALAQGLNATYVTTGDPRNLLVLRQGSTAESNSQIMRDEGTRMRYTEGIARDAHDVPLVSAEIILLVYLERRDGSGGANVLVRGMKSAGLALRPQARLVAGRMLAPGRRECVVSQRIADRFSNCQVGESFRSGATEWHVVGIFDAARTAYESEIWIDSDEARAVFRRDFFGSVLLRTDGPEGAATVKRRLEADRMLQVRVLTEADYYKEQTQMAGPIRFMGGFLAVVMSVGAAFAAMNTMYAAIGARTREIGTLRVLGFRRREVYVSLLGESVLLALVGGVLGCLLALPLNGVATGTIGWNTFAEVAFEFRITPGLMGKGMLFALVMGVLGGLLPARMAARKPVLDALRAA